MKTNYMKIKIALFAGFFSGTVFVSCNKENEVSEIVNQESAVLSSDVEQDEQIEFVPFFELAKGDTIEKGIYREKPLFSEDVQVLFSSQETTSMSGKNPLTKASGYSGGSGYIYDLKTSVRDKNDAPTTMDGYTKIPVDLNEGAGGKWIFLYYKKTSQPKDALFNVNVRISSTRNLVANGGYRKLGLAFANGGWTDLNQGAGGKYINLEGIDAKTYYQKGFPYPYPGSSVQSYLVYEDIAIVSSSSALRWNSLPGWTIILSDLNSGCGGKYIYLCYRQVRIYS